MSTLYMKTDEKEISKYVIFTGDPFHVDKLKDYLDNPKHIAFNREFNTYTGTYKGLPITITSTGIGYPSVAIAVEEMYECGMEVAIRLGTMMSMIEGSLGDFIIPIGVLKRESTSNTYVEEGYPAIADISLVNAMNKSAEAFGKRYYNGISATIDGFYSQMFKSKFSIEKNRDIGKLYRELKSIGICGVDMESSIFLILGSLMGIKSAVVTAVTALENLEVLKGKDRDDIEDCLIKIVLEGLYTFSKKSI